MNESTLLWTAFEIMPKTVRQSNLCGAIAVSYLSETVNNC